MHWGRAKSGDEGWVPKRLGRGRARHDAVTKKDSRGGTVPMLIQGTDRRGSAGRGKCVEVQAQGIIKGDDSAPRSEPDEPGRLEKAWRKNRWLNLGFRASTCQGENCPEKVGPSLSKSCDMNGNRKGLVCSSRRVMQGATDSRGQHDF